MNYKKLRVGKKLSIETENLIVSQRMSNGNIQNLGAAEILHCSKLLESLIKVCTDLNIYEFSS